MELELTHGNPGSVTRHVLQSLHLWCTQQYTLTLIAAGRLQAAKQFLQQVRPSVYDILVFVASASNMAWTGPETRPSQLQVEIALISRFLVELVCWENCSACVKAIVLSLCSVVMKCDFIVLLLWYSNIYIPVYTFLLFPSLLCICTIFISSKITIDLIFAAISLHFTILHINLPT